MFLISKVYITKLNIVIKNATVIALLRSITKSKTEKMLNNNKT